MTTRSRRLAGLMLASVFAAAACTPPSQENATPPGGSAVVAHDADLSAYLVPAPGDATDVDGGPITLAEDAAGNGNPQKRTETLQTYGFQAEVDRGWKGADGSEIEIVLIRFSSSENATIYVKNVEENNIFGVTTWPVPDLPDAIVFEDIANSGDGATQLEGNAVEGDTAVLVFDKEIGTAAPDPVIALTKAQYVALTVAPVSSPSAPVPSS